MLVGAFLGLIVALNVAIVGFHAYRARNQLNGARAMLQQARTAIAAGNVDKALSAVSGMRGKTASAEASTSGSVWHFDEHLPFVGSSLVSARSLAASVNSITATALPQLTRSVTDLKGGQLRNPDGSFNLALVQRTSGALTGVTTSLTNARTQVAALPAHPLIGTIGHARNQLLDQIKRSARRPQRRLRGGEARSHHAGGRRATQIFPRAGEPRGITRCRWPSSAPTASWSSIAASFPWKRSVWTMTFRRSRRPSRRLARVHRSLATPSSPTKTSERHR